MKKYFNMDQDLLKKLTEQDQKLEAIYISTEKTRRYFMWTLIITIIMVALPLFGLIFAVPVFLQSLSGYGF